MTRGLIERPSALAHSRIDTQSVVPGSFTYVHLDPDFVTGPSTLPLLRLPCRRPCSSIFQILDGLIRCSLTMAFNRTKNPSRVDLSDPLTRALSSDRPIKVGIIGLRALKPSIQFLPTGTSSPLTR